MQINRDKRNILQQEKFLTPGYTPDKLVHREDEVEEIKNSIKPMFKWKSPQNLFIYGPPGTCKTSCVKRALDDLDNNTTATPVYVNAWNYDTRTSCYAKILHNLGIPLPRKGKPVDVLYDRIVETASKKKDLVIAIDEVDQLGAELSKTLYDLVTIDRDLDTRSALIVIGYEPNTLETLDRRVRSRLAPKRINFSPYQREELIDILETKVKRAFRPETVGQEVIKRIADFVASKSGDCRMAQGILMRAGRLANSKKSQELHIDLVEEVLESY